MTEAMCYIIYSNANVLSQMFIELFAMDLFFAGIS